MKKTKTVFLYLLSYDAVAILWMAWEFLIYGRLCPSVKDTVLAGIYAGILAAAIKMKWGKKEG